MSGLCQHYARERPAELRLQAFIDLVHVTGACDFQILLHWDEIEQELDAADIRELLTTDRSERQT